MCTSTLSYMAQRGAKYIQVGILRLSVQTEFVNTVNSHRDMAHVCPDGNSASQSKEFPFMVACLHSSSLVLAAGLALVTP